MQSVPTLAARKSDRHEKFLETFRAYDFSQMPVPFVTLLPALRGTVESRMSNSSYSPAEPITLATLLIVSPDSELAHSLALSLLDEPYDIYVANSIGDAQTQLIARTVDVVLVDQQLEDGFDGELFGYLSKRLPAVIRILLGRGECAANAKRAVRTGSAHHCLPVTLDQGELALVLYNSLVQRSFLPPESEGVLPVASSRPPASALQPSRAPGAS